MRTRARVTTALTVVAALTASGCACIGRDPAPAAPPGYVQELILPAEQPNSVQGLENFNPYAPAPLTATWLYEPLMIRDLFSCELVPWLATGYEWPDQQTLVLSIRQGVNWGDGVPFTAKDVAFTLNAAKTYPGADKAGLWGELFGAPATEVVATDDATVRISFAGPAATKLDALLNTMKIVPEHIYGPGGDITTFVDKNPVGTGPYQVGEFNGRRLTLVRKDDYWQPDAYKVQQLSLEGAYDANSGALKLRNGDLDYYTGDIPNPERSVARNSATDFYYSPAGTTVLAPNNERFPTSDPKFRTAMAYGIDKAQLARKASFGVMEPASQTMVKLPVQQDLLPEKYRADGGYLDYDPAKAAQLLDEAGYKLGPDGKRTGPNGEAISLVFSVQAGFVDYLAMGDVVVRNLQALGIDTRLIATDPNAVDAQKKSGDFDMLLDYVNGGCVRAKDLGGKLGITKNSTASDLLHNVARYRNADVDALVSQYEATTDETEQADYAAQLIDVFYQQVPYIALQYAPTRLIYNTRAASGWPSPENPYPTDNALYVLTHLRPAS